MEVVLLGALIDFLIPFNVPAGFEIVEYGLSVFVSLFVFSVVLRGVFYLFNLLTGFGRGI